MWEKIQKITLITILLLVFTSCGQQNNPSEIPTETDLIENTENASGTPTAEAEEVITGPQIISYTPLDGQQLLTAPIITIQFDSEMNQTATEAAWTFYDSNGNEIIGLFSWLDKTTMAFTPEESLDTESEYSAVLSTDAVDIEGAHLAEEVTFNFLTTTGLQIGNVFPQNKTSHVDPNTGITVLFNQPVEPLRIYEEQDTATQPISFNPEITGTGKWVNSSTYIFQPAQPLASGTTYTATIPAGLEDVVGHVLTENYEWEFSTAYPEVSDIFMENEYWREEVSTVASGALLDTTFNITFKQEMNTESVESALSFILEETREEIPFNTTWNEEATIVSITAQQQLENSEKYVLSLSDTAQDISGGHLDHEVSLTILTVNLPKVSQVSPIDKSVQDYFHSNVGITFNTAMDTDSFEGHIDISPEPEEEFEWFYNKYYYALDAYFLEPSTNYTITLLPGIKDIYGNEIEEAYTFSFETAGLSPQASLLMPYYPLIYRENTQQEFFISYTNVEEFSTKLSALTQNQLMSILDYSGNGRYYSNDTSLWEWELEEESPLNKQIIKNFTLTTPENEPLPAGFYMISMNAGPIYNGDNNQDYSTFVVATDNIVLKATKTDALAWVTDINTGEPTPNVLVEFYDPDFKYLGAWTTDENGVVNISDISNAKIAIINDGEHVALGYLNTGSGVTPGEFGIWTNYYANTSDLYAYLYTDRPLYRPGQEVFYKGILRYEDDLQYSLSYLSEVDIEITFQGDTIFTDTVPVNAMGTFSGEFMLDEAASLGNYYIMVSAPTGEYRFIDSISFNVAEYIKPEFEVNVSSETDQVLLGEDLNFEVDALYYSGGFVAGAEIDWTLTANEFNFYPESPYQRYSFSNRDYYYHYSQQTEEVALSSGEDEADIQGHFALNYPSQDATITGSQSVTLQANVTDTANNLVSGRETIIMHQSLYYAGIRTQKYIGRVGESQTFDIVVLDWDSNPIPEIGVVVEIVKSEWHSVQEQDEYGQLHWVTTVEETPVTEITDLQTGDTGRAEAEFIPEEGGSYKAYVTVTDENGGQHTASTRIWVSSSSYISWRQTNDNSFELIQNKDAYSPGETAEILIAQPFENDVYALVTVERGHIQTSEVILLDSNSVIYELPITAEMAPKVYVSVAVIQGADESTLGSAMKMGMTEIDVDTSEQTLQVDISTNVEQAGPGDQVTYSVEVTDLDGTPVQSEVSFSLVDKALLALSSANSGEIISSFYHEKALSVRTSSSTVLNAELYNSEIEPTDPEGGDMGSGSKGGGLAGIITVRENFKDTAYFEAQVQTNANGQASVTVTLPENLTTWQMDVRAVTTNTEVGQNTHDLTSTKPLIVNLQTPRFFVVEDTSLVGALLINNTKEDLDVDVNLEATGVEFNNEQSQTVSVGAGQQSYVTWEVNIPYDSERVDFTVHANSGEYSDASKPAAGTLDNHGIPVFRYATTENIGSSGMLESGESLVEGIQLPTTMEFYEAQLMVETAPSLAAGLQDGLTYLDNYPYSCNEQTASRLLSNLLNYHILKLSGKDPDYIEDDLKINISSSLARLYTTQNADGGWGWWPGKSHVTTSAYVLDVLLIAKENGFPVSENVLNDAAVFVNGNIRAFYSETSPVYLSNQRAYMLYVVSKADRGSTSRIDNLFQNRDNLSLYGKALLMQAMQNKEMSTSDINILKNELIDAAILSAAGVHWEEDYPDYYNWGSDTRTTSIVMNALLHTDPDLEILPGAIRWLMVNRTDSHWYSTQETAWVLRGLVDWLDISDDFSADYEYLINMNGEELFKGVATSDNISTPVLTTAELEQTSQDELEYLEISRDDGPGNLYYSMYASVTLPVKNVNALSNGVTISREYYQLDDLETPITEAAQGDIVQVRITIVAPNDLHYVIIDDPLPAGLASLDQNLLTNPQIPSTFTYEDMYSSGWGWWYFDHTEMYDEKTTISADYLPAGTYMYVYYARAATPGTYSVIPTTAAEFYFPDVFGRADGSEFTITLED